MANIRFPVVGRYSAAWAGISSAARINASLTLLQSRPLPSQSASAGVSVGAV